MRIVAGKFRSRPLIAPAGLATRPTTDRLRETLFNVLTNGPVNRIAGARFLDLYAGSGAVGIEALSRGATASTFVESAPPAIAILRKNLANLAIPPAEASIQTRAAQRALPELAKSHTTFNVIFLDPPYEEAAEYATTLSLLGSTCASLLAPGAIVIAEHRRSAPTAETYGTLTRIRLLQQGDAALSFYQPNQTGSATNSSG